MTPASSSSPFAKLKGDSQALHQRSGSPVKLPEPMQPP